jgi:hypothetical protein
MNYSRQLLSGSTNGKEIPVVATSTPGTTLHTALAGTSGFDEIYAWVSNVTAAPVTLTIEWGGTGTANQMTQAYSIPANSGPVQVLFGQVLQNSLVVGAFASSANALNVSGYVNRIS